MDSGSACVSSPSNRNGPEHVPEGARLKARKCLPIARVLETVTRVEKDVLSFYEAAASLPTGSEVLNTFRGLALDLKTSSDRFAVVCESLNCGSSSLDATEADT